MRNFESEEVPYLTHSTEFLKPTYVTKTKGNNLFIIRNDLMVF